MQSQIKHSHGFTILFVVQTSCAMTSFSVMVMEVDYCSVRMDGGNVEGNGIQHWSVVLVQ